LAFRNVVLQRRRGAIAIEAANYSVRIYRWTNAAIVGERLARSLGVRVGDKVLLLTNTGTGGTNAVGVNGLSLCSAVIKAREDPALCVPIATARISLRTEVCMYGSTGLRADQNVYRSSV